MPLWDGIRMPQTQLAKLRYAQNVSMTSLTSVSKFILSMNCAYRPDHATGGVQPEYYDFWANMYQYYRVYNCSVEVRFTNASTSNPMVAVLFPYPSMVVSSSFLHEMIMLPNSSSCQLGIASG